MFARLTATILRQPRLASVLLALVILLFAAGIAELRADFNLKSFFGSRDPEAVYLESYLERWGEDDMLVLVLDTHEDRGMLDRERLRALEALASSLEESDGVAKVLSITRVPRVERGPFGTFVPMPLFARMPAADAPEARVDAWQDGLLADSRVVPNYVSADGRYGALLVALSVDTGDLNAVRPVVLGVQEVVDTNPLDGVDVTLAGIPAIRANIVSVIVRDQLLLVPLAGGAITILLGLLFRSKHGVLIPGIAAGVPIVMLMGTMGWTGEAFSLINQTYLALVPAIAVADAIHLLSRYHEEGRALVGPGGTATPEQRNEAIIRAMQVMGVACFLTSFTTVVGFLSLLRASMPILQGYGVYAAIGVSFAYFTVLFIVPLSLLFTRPGARRLVHDDSGLLGRTLEGAYRLSTRYPGLCVAAALAVTGGALWQGQYVETDWEVSRTFDDSHPVTQGNMVLDEHMGGILALEFDLTGPPGVFEEPEVLAAMAEAEAEAMALSSEGVKGTWSLATLLRTTSTLVGGPDAVPDTDAKVARLLSLHTQGELLPTLVDEERSRARLLVRTRDVGSIAFLGLGDRLTGVVDDALGPHGIEAHLTGSSLVGARGVGAVTTDLRDSLIAAFFVIGVIISLLFRDVRLGLLTLVPNALPLIVGYGTMGLLSWNLEPGPAVVFTIAIGISVDSGIHVLARFREERQAGASVDDALREAIFHSGRAVAITAVILAVGFAVNIQSTAPANASFGRMGTVVILAALVSNLLVLPAMLKLGLGGRAADDGEDGLQPA